MVDADTFLTALYVLADDFCKSQLPAGNPPGPKPSLTGSEVITLVIFSQWARFPSERDFYRYAVSRLRPAFPTLPRRSQFNRLTRRSYGILAAFFRHLADLLQGQLCIYEALDSSGVPTRSAKRRGAGWLPGQADIGWSNRLGWYEGFHLLLSLNFRRGHYRLQLCSGQRQGPDHGRGFLRLPAYSPSQAAHLG